MTYYEGAISFATWLAWMYEWRNMIYANRYIGLTGIEIWRGPDTQALEVIQSPSKGATSRSE